MMTLAICACFLLLVALQRAAGAHAAALGVIRACDCKWPDLVLAANSQSTCDAAPKMCRYCMESMASAYYGSESTPSIGCVAEGRGLDVCLRVAQEVQVRARLGISCWHSCQRFGARSSSWEGMLAGGGRDRSVCM
jgi:hypothetical protein